MATPLFIESAQNGNGHKEYTVKRLLTASMKEAKPQTHFVTDSVRKASRTNANTKERNVNDDSFKLSSMETRSSYVLVLKRIELACIAHRNHIMLNNKCNYNAMFPLPGWNALSVRYSQGHRFHDK